MKASELQELSVEELEAKLEELTKERFNLRFRSATEAIDNPMRFRTLRRDIARIKTVLRQRGIRR
ncbi:MAG TPA: 50S ribosomal protein L29 [Gemmatimonadales bacterium]|nr:50S ribosomal protein L29 [Gemmatimonadales bacterium]